MLPKLLIVDCFYIYTRYIMRCTHEMIYGVDTSCNLIQMPKTTSSCQIGKSLYFVLCTSFIPITAQKFVSGTSGSTSPIEK